MGKGVEKNRAMEKLKKLINIFREDRRLRRYAVILGGLFSLSCVLGGLLQRTGRTFRTVPEFLLMLPLVFVMTLVSSFVAGGLLLLLGKLWEGTCKSRLSQKEYAAWKVFLFAALLILLCWLPVFLAYYPSVFAYDAEGQLYQVMAHDYSTHHPLIHTLFLGAFFELGDRALGSCSAGMAVHSMAQMVLMAAIFGYAIMVLYRERTSWVMRFLLFLFYALFPVNSILALSTTKDVLFSGLVLLYLIKACQCIGGKREPSRWQYAALIFVTALMLLFRNNALYACLVSWPVIFCFLKKMGKAPEHSQRYMTETKKYFISVLATLLLFAAGAVGLKTATAAHSGSPREMLSVPLQQMARCRVVHEDAIEPQLRAELDAYLPSEWVFAAYNPYLADPVKNRAVIHDNPVGLMKTWLRLGAQFPMTYVDAFLDNSIGYWYLPDKTHSTIYGIGTESGFGYLSTDNRTMPAGYEIIEHSYLPGLRAFLERIVSDNEYQKIPVLPVLFAPAFYWWLLCLYLSFVLYKKEDRMLLPALFLPAYYLTLLLSPTVLIRYMYPFVVSVPVLLCLLSAKKGARE